MGEVELKKYIDDSLSNLLESDVELFKRDISERSLTARLMHHLQNLVPDWHVDVEFNRQGDDQYPKRLDLEEECANKVNSEGKACVVPDLIIHQRGNDYHNLFVAEVKKTTNTTPRDCDRKRVDAFLRQFNYKFGAIIEFETRRNKMPEAKIIEWFRSDRILNALDD